MAINFTEDAVPSLREGADRSLQSAIGTAHFNDVVMAVGRAESALKTVVALRGKVIHAYQEVLRTPI
jgi:flagellar hook-basal body complex protein FliE